MNKTLGITKDNRYFAHKLLHDSYECPERLKRIYSVLDSSSYDNKFKTYNAKEIDKKSLFAVHSSFYVSQIKNHCNDENPFSYDKDTYLMPDSYYTAKLAAGGCIELADAIMKEEITRGFSLVRPPGHHAESGRGMGFCIFNNVALTAQYLQDKYKLNRILILDFDVHHGNGTQDIFYETDKVLVLSIHQKSIFPHTGRIIEFGKDRGYGYNINVPVYPQYGDLEYNYLFGKVVQNIVEQFMPQFILVSAGFDGHKNDHISDICLSTEWFGIITENIKYFAQEFSDNRLLYILEGGYNIESLEASVFETIDALSNNFIVRPSYPFSEKVDIYIKEKLQPVIGKKWSII